MSRLRLVPRLITHLTAVSALILTMGAPARAVPIMINNGLAPPDPANVIDDATYSDDSVYVRNVGCPPGWPAVLPLTSCPSPAWVHRPPRRIALRRRSARARSPRGAAVRRSPARCGPP